MKKIQSFVVKGSDPETFFLELPVCSGIDDSGNADMKRYSYLDKKECGKRINSVSKERTERNILRSNMGDNRGDSNLMGFVSFGILLFL